MSHQMPLIPELEQLLNDYVSVGERFQALANSYGQQKMLLQKQQTEIQNYAKQLSALRQTEIENERLLKSYDQLKVDYDLLHSAIGIQQKEIREETKKRVHELEEELNAVKAKASEQANSHQIVVNQIVGDYEAKLRDADAKIRQLSNTRNEPPHLKYAATAPKNKRFGQLDVEVKPSATSNRGRGRARGTATKRKLFKSDHYDLFDLPSDE